MNKKGTRALASATVVGLVLATVSTGNVKAAAGDVNKVQGSNRYETAANVAKANWKDGAKDVIIASGEGFADSLSASVLAKKLNAPIILTTAGELNSNAKSALETLKPENVYVIGGDASVSKSVRDGLKKDYKVTELGGKTRFETNLAVANHLVDKLGVKADNVMVVNGQDGFSDALSAAPVAAAKEQVLLIVGKDPSKADLAADFVKKHNSKVTVIGTEGVVPTAVYNKLGATTRVNGGGNRFETNLNIMKYFKLNADKIYVANATDGNNGYADALVASALAGKNGAPLVLVDTKNSEGTKNAIKYIKESKTDKTEVSTVGGKGVMPDEIVSEIEYAVNPELSAAEKAVKAYEDAKIGTDEEITAAKALQAPAKKAVEAVKNQAQKDALNARIAAKDQAIKDAEAKLALKVESVSAINGKTVKIKFTKSVDKATVIGGTEVAPVLKNITFDEVTTTPATPKINSSDAKAELSTDGKELTITPKDAEYFGGQYVVTIPTAVKDKDSNAIIAYAAVHTLNDETRPVISEPTYKANSIAHFALSEPINVTKEALEEATTITKVSDGSTVSSTGLVKISADRKSIELNTDSLKPSKDYKVAFIGLKDFAGNLIATNPSIFTVQNKVLDEVAPEIKSIEATKVGEMKITFSEKLKDLGSGKVGQFVVGDLSGTPIDIDTTKGSGNATVDSTGTIITVKDSTNLTAGLKTITVKGYEDLSGNDGKAVSKVIEFKEDTTAPTLISSKVEKIDDIEYLVLTYSENVKPENSKDINGKWVKDYVETNLTPAITTDTVTEAAAPITPANFTLYNKDVNGNSKSVKLDLSSLNAGDYTLDLPTGLVKDEGKNENEAKKVEFTRTSNSNKPKLTTDGVNGIEKVDNNTYTVKFDRKLDPTTALDVNNYVIEGATVKNAIFTKNDATGATVKLSIADGSITLNGERAVTIKNVKSSAGVVMKTVKTVEKFTENVKPTIKSAELTSTDTITLTFSESMNVDTIVEATSVSDFNIYIGGEKVKGEITEGKVDGDTTTKFTLKLDSEFDSNDLSKDIIVKPVARIDAEDLNGNVVNFTSITVTK